MDEREVQTKTVDPDPEQEGEEGEVITTTTEYYLNPDRVHLYGASGGGTEITIGVIKNGNPDGVGTFELTDIRDSKTYLVRRLADGNCWMVQNLDLALADYADKNPNTVNLSENPNAVLTSKNTDLNSANKTYWDPAESVGGSANFADYSLAYLGVEEHYQYRFREDTAPPSYLWRTLLNESGEILDGTNGSEGNASMSQESTTGLWTESNSRSAIPRSFDTGSSWVKNTTVSHSYTTSDNYHTGGTPNDASEYTGD